MKTEGIHSFPLTYICDLQAAKHSHGIMGRKSRLTLTETTGKHLKIFRQVGCSFTQMLFSRAEKGKPERKGPVAVPERKTLNTIAEKFDSSLYPGEK